MIIGSTILVTPSAQDMKLSKALDPDETLFAVSPIVLIRGFPQNHLDYFGS